MHNYNNSSHVELIMSKLSQNLFTTLFFIFFHLFSCVYDESQFTGNLEEGGDRYLPKNHQKICHCYIYIKSNRRISCASLSYTITTSLLQKAETEIGRFVWLTNWMIENKSIIIFSKTTNFYHLNIFFIQF